MKNLVLLLAAPALVCLSQAQSVPVQAAPVGQPVAGKTRLDKQIRPAVKVPASLRPSAAAQVSTAQGEAVRGQKPGLQRLPEFSVTTREGLVISSQTLTQNMHWLLVYRRDNCIPCDRLMNVLAAGASVEPGQGTAYAIVVAGRDKDSLDKVRAGYSSLANARWVSDRSEASTHALQLHGAPVIYGMDGAHIRWVVPGNLGNPANVEKMASSWVSSRTLISTPGPIATPATGK